MRHPLLLAAMIACLAATSAPAFAQFGGGGGGGPGGGGGEPSDSDKAAAQDKQDEDWDTTAKKLDLPGAKNAGPCPYVKVLWDADRYVELKDNREAFDAVGYTGEIQKLASACAYKGLEPIRLTVDILFALGRGPQAQSATKDYTYWVAVTDKDYGVLNKQYFTLHANFPPGTDRIMMTDALQGITIPRANSGVSGANFEVLVGFDVTPDMAAWNQAGKRFTLNAGAAQAQAGAAPGAQ